MIAGVEIENGLCDPDHAPLRVICSPYVGLDIPTCAPKLTTVASDMVSAHQNLNGSRGLTTPFQGCLVILGLALAMMDLSTKFEVSISTFYKDMKGRIKCRKGVVWCS